jgi:hypothetical protein
MVAWRGFVAAGLLASGFTAWACSSDPAAAPAGAPPDAGETDVDPVPGDAATDAATGGDLGAACKVDGDCAAPLRCWNEAVGGRWPANGYCSIKCTGTDSSQCEALKPGSVCLRLGATPLNATWCAEPCTFGPAGGTLRSGPVAGKCHGRPDVACSSYGVPSCRPSCNDDSNCGPNATCNAATGLCSEEGARWDEIGIAADDAGQCGIGLVPIDLTPKICGLRCTLGVVPTCRWDGGGPANAACVFTKSGNGAGDEGQCGKLCDCNDDCFDGLACTALAPSLQTESGRKGSCGGTGAALPCADAGDGG